LLCYINFVKGKGKEKAREIIILSSDDDEKSVIVLSSDDEFAPSTSSNLASTSRYQEISNLFINNIEAKSKSNPNHSI
jgi:hypothetical protein